MPLDAAATFQKCPGIGFEINSNLLASSGLLGSYLKRQTKKFYILISIHIATFHTKLFLLFSGQWNERILPYTGNIYVAYSREGNNVSRNYPVFEAEDKLVLSNNCGCKLSIGTFKYDHVCLTLLKGENSIPFFFTPFSFVIRISYDLWRIKSRIEMKSGIVSTLKVEGKSVCVSRNLYFYSKFTPWKKSADKWMLVLQIVTRTWCYNINFRGCICVNMLQYVVLRKI